MHRLSEQQSLTLLRSKVAFGRLIWRSCSVVLFLGALGLTSCRRERVWIGADYNENGKVLRLSSEEPFCGCFDATNISGHPIVLQSQVVLNENGLHRLERGQETLPPGASIRERFDWSGPDANDVYLMTAQTPDGKPLTIQNVIRMNSFGWPFTPCQTHECKKGSLYMNTGVLHRR